MSTFEVFSARALRFLINEGGFSLAASSNEFTMDSPGVTTVVSGDVRYWVSLDDTVRSRKLVFRANPLLTKLSSAKLRMVMDRALNLSERTSKRPLSLPPSWRPWRDSDRVAFCAASKSRISSNPRWSAQVYLQDNDIFFWDLYPGDDTDRHDLRDEAIDIGLYYRSVSLWPDALASAKSAQHSTSATELAAAMTLTIPTRDGRYVPATYSYWLDDDRLTPDQRAFVLNDPPYSIRLKGPAGSGKTLALELKAIRERHRLIEAGHEEPKILFATHSWAMAEQIGDNLQQLDDLGGSGQIAVLPLLEVVRELRPPAAGLEILGTDSEEGREYQQMCVGMAAEEFVGTDWISYRRCSSEFAEQMESIAHGRIDQKFLDDLVTECSVVLGGEGIQDGPRDEARYLELQRGPWAITVASEHDLRAIYAIYRIFLSQTRSATQITSDQFISTALHWFGDPEWGALRAGLGYDTIFVDELHLFNPQERAVLNYLGRKSSVYPRLFMSLDPLQSTSGSFGNATLDRAIAGDQESVEFHEIHRFSPQILHLVQHINNSFPTEDFGDEWGVNLRAAKSSAPDGPKPVLLACGSVGGEVAAVFKAATEALERFPRVAIAIVDPRRASDFFEAADGLADIRGRSVATIRTRDDLGKLGYSGRGIVVGRADDLAGLQFNEVVVGGLGDPAEFERLEHRRLAFMSALYVAVSRASTRVSIAIDEDSSATPTVLKEALKSGIVTEVPRLR